MVSKAPFADALNLVRTDEIRVHCIRQIPEPARLERRVTPVYAHCFDLEHEGVPLFSDDMRRQIEHNYLVHVRNGCLSDPLGRSMYRLVKEVRIVLKMHMH